MKSPRDLFSDPCFLKLGVLISSVTQCFSPLFSSLNDQTSSSNSDYTNPKITPAGYAFVVWGVITILGLGYGIYQFSKARRNTSLHLAIAPKLIPIYLCFSLWLVAAEKQWLITTVLIFVFMYYLLGKVLIQVITEEKRLTVPDKILLLTQVGIYAGWTSVAIFANTASAVKFYGVSDGGLNGTLWQGLLLLFATANIIFGIHRFKANLPFLLAALWAVTGIYVGLLDDSDAQALRLLTVVFGFIVILFAVNAIYRRPDNFLQALK